MVFALQSHRICLDEEEPWIFIGTSQELAKERKQEIEDAKALLADDPSMFGSRRVVPPRRRIQLVAGGHKFNLKVLGMADLVDQDLNGLRSLLRQAEVDSSTRKAIDYVDALPIRWMSYLETNKNIMDQYNDYSLRQYCLMESNQIEVEDTALFDGNWFSPKLQAVASFVKNECLPWDGREAQLLGIRGIGRGERKKSRPAVVFSTGLGGQLARRARKGVLEEERSIDRLVDGRLPEDNPTPRSY